MIPKIIHYCWFGPAKPSALELKCMASWRKHCPDYQIKLWNEDNFDVNYCEFTKEAYRLGKYAFVSDVARLYALQQEGGVYLDTDMLLLKFLPESYLTYSLFLGKESRMSLSAGLIGAVSHNEHIDKVLAYYSSLIFSDTPPLIPHVLNLNIKESKIDNKDEILILDKDYFYPLPYKLKKYHWNKFVKDHTIGVHLWNASWQKSSEYNLNDRIKYFISKYYIPRSFLTFSNNL